MFLCYHWQTRWHHIVWTKHIPWCWITFGITIVMFIKQQHQWVWRWLSVWHSSNITSTVTLQRHYQWGIKVVIIHHRTSVPHMWAESTEHFTVCEDKEIKKMSCIRKPCHKLYEHTRNRDINDNHCRTHADWGYPSSVKSWWANTLTSLMSISLKTLLTITMRSSLHQKDANTEDM